MCATINKLSHLFSALECPPLIAPANGSIRWRKDEWRNGGWRSEDKGGWRMEDNDEEEGWRTKIGDPIYFSCDPNFQLVGEAILKCLEVHESAVWNHEFPICLQGT